MSPLVAVLAAILLILILPPTIYLVVTSFYTTRPDGSFDQFTLRYYQQLFTSPYFLSSLRNTAIFSVGSALVAITIGVVQALIVERTNTPGRRTSFSARWCRSAFRTCSMSWPGCCCSAATVRSMI